MIGSLLVVEDVSRSPFPEVLLLLLLLLCRPGGPNSMKRMNDLVSIADPFLAQ